MSNSHELPDWFPDWAPAPPTRRQEATATPTHDTPRWDLLTPPTGGSLRPTLSQEATPQPTPTGLVPPERLAPAVSQTEASVSRVSAVTTEAEGESGFMYAAEIPIIVTPSQDRLVKRKLRGIHLFMITINATLGTGLYWRGGQILELGGPLAVLLAFLIVGVLAWAVMQCITELLCIWPVPGAMSVYVSEFVDTELGIAVGVAYWFTYSVSFAALIATTAALLDFFPGIKDNKVIDGTVTYSLIPLVLVGINMFGIQTYGWIEVFFGSVKITMLIIIMITLIVIKGKALNSTEGGVTDDYWKDATAYDTVAAKNWGTALMMCLSFATFAYVGVEIIAASALEAKWPKRRSTEDRVDSDISRRSNDTLIGSSVKFSAIYISVLATIAYSLSGTLVSLDISRADCDLPRLSWLKDQADNCRATEGEHSDTSTASAFVIIAQQSGTPRLAEVFNVFLIFTALTCANTNLYVASRTLFGLTSRLEGGEGQPWLLRILAWFGRTNHRKVPMRAMIFSAMAFWWVPFLQLQEGIGPHTATGMFIEVLAEMGSVGVLIVWACQCLAFIRYYRCIYRHRVVLQAQKISQVRRWDKDDWKDYPYRSHGQPFVAYLALAGCLAVMFVANSAALWGGFHPLPFLSSYLIVMVFFGLWVLLKIFRGAKWSLVDLSKASHVVKKFKDLHDIRLGAS
ncbi:amino acid permease-domain-containing protein [Podospora aff. communis PSN243]|uniref:Amino acid permease-domain-containing protein n=1 Tax=Podospora aff. communis PSN243 TaxID=3040156 RepID=A0AAV9G6A3_9PEZI|nr:amino acid permease-domain-containing protein [Podospora aff. communis PSN243]